MQLTSPAFGDGGPIPRQYTEDGNNSSPPLRWEEVPEAAAELVLIVDDPDAPSEQPFVHWVVYKIPADTEGMPASVPHEEQLVSPPGALQGLNDFSRNSLGYGGPAPPRGHGVHQYNFTLYAIDEPLDLGPGMTKDAVLEAMAGHVLEQAHYVGTYERTESGEAEAA